VAQDCSQAQSQWSPTGGVTESTYTHHAVAHVYNCPGLSARAVSAAIRDDKSVTQWARYSRQVLGVRPQYQVGTTLQSGSDPACPQAVQQGTLTVTIQYTMTTSQGFQPVELVLWLWPWHLLRISRLCKVLLQVMAFHCSQNRKPWSAGVRSKHSWRYTSP